MILPTQVFSDASDLSVGVGDPVPATPPLTPAPTVPLPGLRHTPKTSPAGPPTLPGSPPPSASPPPRLPLSLSSQPLAPPPPVAWRPPSHPHPRLPLSFSLFSHVRGGMGGPGLGWGRERERGERVERERGRPGEGGLGGGAGGRVRGWGPAGEGWMGVPEAGEWGRAGLGGGWGWGRGWRGRDWVAGVGEFAGANGKVTSAGEDLGWEESYK
ncbi:hypothetical protein TIFTF001_019599, partial [Ficus carica]